MPTCPKCGFKNEENTPDCPKCGAIYAKAEQVRANERTAQKLEAAINQKIEKEMGTFTADDGYDLWEQEARNDRKAYPFIGFLSSFFAFAATLFGIGCIAGAIFFWDILTQLGFFSDRDKIFLVGAIALTVAISVGTLLAISGALTLGRDIANNTRASREYLLKLVTSKQK
jgi:predicted nucleic-acid-binding Zn-ribbon protein